MYSFIHYWQSFPLATTWVNHNTYHITLCILSHHSLHLSHHSSHLITILITSLHYSSHLITYSLNISTIFFITHNTPHIQLLYYYEDYHITLQTLSQYSSHSFTYYLCTDVLTILTHIILLTSDYSTLSISSHDVLYIITVLFHSLLNFSCSSNPIPSYISYSRDKTRHQTRLIN